MAKKSQRPVIQPLENYNTATDDEIVSLATAVAKGMTGNAKFPAPPGDPAVLKTEVATFSVLISDAKDGSKKVIAEKNRQRHTIVDMLKLLARYVEVMSKGDMADFTSSRLPAEGETGAGSSRAVAHTRCSDGGAWNSRRATPGPDQEDSQGQGL